MYLIFVILFVFLELLEECLNKFFIEVVQKF